MSGRSSASRRRRTSVPDVLRARGQRARAGPLRSPCSSRRSPASVSCAGRARRRGPPRRTRLRVRRSWRTCPSRRIRGPGAPCPRAGPAGCRGHDAVHGRRPRRSQSRRLDDDDGHIRRVSRKGLGDDVAVAPSSTTPRSRARRRGRGRRSGRPWRGRPRPRPRGRRPAARTARRAGSWPWSRRPRSRRRRTATTAIRWPSGRNPRRPSRTAACGTPCARARAAAASAFATMCGRRADGEVGDRAQLGGAGLALLDEGPVGEDVVDHAEHPDAGHAEGEPDRRGRPPRRRPRGPAARSPGRPRCRRRPAGPARRCGPCRRRRRPSVGPGYQSRWSSATLRTAADSALIESV